MLADGSLLYSISTCHLRITKEEYDQKNRQSSGSTWARQKTPVEAAGKLVLTVCAASRLYLPDLSWVLVDWEKLSLLIGGCKESTGSFSQWKRTTAKWKESAALKKLLSDVTRIGPLHNHQGSYPLLPWTFVYCIIHSVERKEVEEEKQHGLAKIR